MRTRSLSALGCELVDLHLMRVDLSGESVGEPLFSDLSDKNEKIEKIAYNAESKRLFVKDWDRMTRICVS